MKTQIELDELKREWICDPCWDIEDTPEFEDHYGALKLWREEYEKQQEDKEQKRLLNKATSLGCTVALVVHLEIMQHRIDELTEYVNCVKYGVSFKSINQQ